MNGLKLCYPAHPKDRGQWAELLFMATAVRLDLKIAKPYGDNARFDVIVEAAGRLHRVQVKCTSVLRYGWYRCICCWSQRTAAATHPAVAHSIQNRCRPTGTNLVRKPFREGTASAGPIQPPTLAIPCGLQPAVADATEKRNLSGKLSEQRKPGGKAMLYTKRDVDFVAVYVIPEDSWFIIPVERVHHKALDLPPRDAASRSQWEQYREAWHLLGARPGLTLHAAAADASNAVEWPDERVSAAPCEVFIVSS